MNLMIYCAAVLAIIIFLGGLYNCKKRTRSCKINGNISRDGDERNEDAEERHSYGDGNEDVYHFID